MNKLVKDYYLTHHGIKGQKWGVRNGPPYPLASSAHSASEREAGWRKSLDKARPRTYNKPASGNGTAEELLVTYGARRLGKSGELDSFVDKGKEALGKLLESYNDEVSDISRQKVSELSKNGKTQQFDRGIKLLERPETVEEAIKHANPHYGDPDYKNNCTLCSIATFLRMHGYDVTAGKTGCEQQLLGGVVEECFKTRVPVASAIKFGKSRKDAEEMLIARFGENAEGVCSVRWIDGGGHAFNWKIEDGNVSFFDGQDSRNDSEVSKYWMRINVNDDLVLARLDNVEISPDGINKWLE